MNTAPVKWAQRKDSLFVTITLADVKDHKIEVAEKKLTFTGTSNDKPYTLNLEFFKEIEVEGSVWNVTPSSVQMKLNKKDVDAEFWPRLLADKHLEKTNVTVDWDRYVDEDDDGKDFDTDGFGNMGPGGPGGMGMGGGMGGMMGGGMPGMEGMDFSKMMAGMGGMPGGMPGMGMDEGEGEDEDSDDEGLPDLESTDN